MTECGCKVYQAIAGVMSDIASIGIAKNQKNSQQGYKFRGIDDVYNALASILSKRGLVILPRVVAKTAEEKTTKNNTIMRHVSVDVEYDIISSEDGSKHTVKTAGEAMDSGDKATNKALSAAYKYMAFQTFCIPTEGDNDADFSSPELAVPSFTEEEKQAMIEDLLRTETLDELKEVYIEFVKQARQSNDNNFISKLESAKDKRKSQFEGIV